MKKVWRQIIMYKISDENFEIAIEKFLKMVKQNDSKKYSESIYNYGKVIRRQAYGDLKRIAKFSRVVYPHIESIESYNKNKS